MVSASPQLGPGMAQPGTEHRRQRSIAIAPVCVACGAWGLAPLCTNCRAGLRRGGSFLVAGVPGRSALHHSGTGRRLVHQLKYHGAVGAAQVLAGLMARLVPDAATAVAPIPRATVRRIGFGVDPAVELAKRVATATGLPLTRVLRPPLWWPRHSTKPQAGRRQPGFGGRPAPDGLVLIDDVVTSGATVRGAMAALGNRPESIASVISATSPGMMAPSKAPIASGRLRDG